MSRHFRQRAWVSCGTLMRLRILGFTWPGFRGPQKTSFLVFCIFCQISPSVRGRVYGLGRPFGPPGAFLRPGGSKNAKNQKTSKAEPRQSKRETAGLQNGVFEIRHGPGQRPERATLRLAKSCALPATASCEGQGSGLGCR